MILTNKTFIIVITFVIVIISVVIHEVMHGYIAKLLGDTTAEEEGRLTLNPIPHIDPISTLALPISIVIFNMVTSANLPIFGAAKPVPVLRHRLKWDEFGMALVAIAGPLTNLALAIAGGLILRASGFTDPYWVTWWLYFVKINVGFFLFNMIPMPPLDGSRVLYAFAPESIQNIMDKIEGFGILIILILLFFGMPLIGSVLSSLYESIIRVILGI